MSLLVIDFPVFLEEFAQQLTHPRSFIHAWHSQAKLRVTRAMLVQALSYLQAMPEMLDLLLPFGERKSIPDFHTGGFHQRTRLSNATQGLHIPERAWSGHGFQICYGLKSVERSETQSHWPWSIRHCAIHHTFDVKNIRSTWMVVKGNRLIEKRIISATGGRGPAEYSSYGTIEEAFAASLCTHLIMFDWSAENWRWYINYMEDEFQKMTTGAIATDADVPMSPKEAEDIFALGSRTNTTITNTSRKSRAFSLRPITQKVDPMPSVAEMQTLPPPKFLINPRTGKKQPLPPGITTAKPDVQRPEVQHARAIQYDVYGQPMFGFRQLQDIQNFEESSNDTVLVLRLNLGVCKQISDFYNSIFTDEELPSNITDNCQRNLLQFQRKIKSIESQLEAQILRVEALLRLIADRKQLVSPKCSVIVC